MCAYPTSQHSFLHLIFMLHCCSNFPHIDHPDQESDRHHSNASPTIFFHIYHLIAWFTVHGRRPLYEKKIVACVFKIRLLWHLKNFTQEKSLLWWRNIFLVFTQVSILHQYKNLVFHLPHVCILGIINVVTHAMKHSNAAAQIKMCCVILIIVREWYLCH